MKPKPQNQSDWKCRKVWTRKREIIEDKNIHDRVEKGHVREGKRIIKNDDRVATRMRKKKLIPRSVLGDSREIADRMINWTVLCWNKFVKRIFLQIVRMKTQRKLIARPESNDLK